VVPVSTGTVVVVVVSADVLLSPPSAQLKTARAIAAKNNTLLMLLLLRMNRTVIPTIHLPVLNYRKQQVSTPAACTFFNISGK
jgi:hypothetical protein